MEETFSLELLKTFLAMSSWEKWGEFFPRRMSPLQVLTCAEKIHKIMTERGWIFLAEEPLVSQLVETLWMTNSLARATALSTKSIKSGFEVFYTRFLNIINKYSRPANEVCSDRIFLTGSLADLILTIISCMRSIGTHRENLKTFLEQPFSCEQYRAEAILHGHEIATAA